MAISVRFSLADLPADTVAVGDEALDGDEVWYVYRTQGDEHVRPSHAALNGSVWRADDPDAPSPPIDYGCRCFLEYVAKPGSKASAVLPPAAVAPKPKAEVFAAHLDENVDGWREMAAKAKEQAPAIRMAYLSVALRSEFGRGAARDLAWMILETIR